MDAMYAWQTSSTASGLEGSVLDGLDYWPRSATRKEWFRITRELVASTIADMDIAHATAFSSEVENCVIEAVVLRLPIPWKVSPSV